MIIQYCCKCCLPAGGQLRWINKATGREETAFFCRTHLDEAWDARERAVKELQR